MRLPYWESVRPFLLGLLGTIIAILLLYVGAVVYQDWKFLHQARLINEHAQALQELQQLQQQQAQQQSQQAPKK
jgi:CHASE3 domain sensor protein